MCINAFYIINDRIQTNIIFSFGLVLLSRSDVNVMLCDLTGTFGVQGATIRKDEVTGAVVVARIMRGGAADRSGELLPTPASPAFISVCSQKTEYDQTNPVKIIPDFE